MFQLPQSQVASLLAQATQWLRAGRPAEAIAPLRDAANRLPGNAAIQHDLGLACLECGRVAEAITALRDSIAADPNFADSHLRLGLALEAAGLLDAALAAYQKAASFPAVAADALDRAGNLLDGQGLLKQAAQTFRRSAERAGKTAPGRIAMARALLIENRDAEAEKLLRRVISAEKNNAAALELLGNTLAEAGRFEDARRYLLRAIDLAPRLAGSYYEVARCERIQAGDPLIERMHAALQSAPLDAAQRIRVHLALGKAMSDLENLEEAMRQFDAAALLRRSLIGFDPSRFESRVDGLIARVSGEWIARQTPREGGGPVPILIAGLPRSGTTLVEQILSSHPEVGAGGELSFWNERGGEWERTAPEAEGDLLARCSNDYRTLLRGIDPGARCVTDKMPLNFQWAGLIHAALARSVIIHCRRDPLDTALSIHQTHFNPRMAFPTGGEELVRYVRGYQKLCAHWRMTLPTDRFVEIDYEALVSEPEPNVRKILSACGLSWNSRCLSPELNTRVIKTPSKWQARQSINRGSVGRWKRYESFLGPLAELRD